MVTYSASFVDFSFLVLWIFENIWFDKMINLFYVFFLIKYQIHSEYISPVSFYRLGFVRQTTPNCEMAKFIARKFDRHDKSFISYIHWIYIIYNSTNILIHIHIMDNYKWLLLGWYNNIKVSYQVAASNFKIINSNTIVISLCPAKKQDRWF